MSDSQSFKVAVARTVREHIQSEIDPIHVSDQVKRRLDDFMATTPCGPMQVTPSEAAEQVICGVS